MTATTSLQYLSIRPTDTAMWQMTAENSGAQQAVLGIFSIVAVPLEIIGRIFYNMALMGYSALCCRAIQQENIPDPDIPELEEILEECLEASQKSLGTFYGQAIGDGLGVFTEFLTRSQAQALRMELEFSQRSAFSCSHLDRFPVGGWTDDTDQALMIVRAEREHFVHSVKPKEIRFAEQLLNWRHHGLNAFSSISAYAFASRQESNSSDPQRARISCQGLGALTGAVLNHPQFAQNPHQAALEVWKQDDLPFESRAAANGAIMRTAPLGVIYRNDWDVAVQEAVRYAKVTHADPRSIASAVAMTVMIAILQRDYSSLSMPRAEYAINEAVRLARAVIRTEMGNIQAYLNAADQARFDVLVLQLELELQNCMHADLAVLDLDERNRIGYTFKCLGAASYALRQAEARCNGVPGTDVEARRRIFRDVIQQIIFEGGDADTNAAVAGALVGAYMGVQAIPPSWRAGLHHQDKTVLRQSIRHAEDAVRRVLERKNQGIESHAYVAIDV